MRRDANEPERFRIGLLVDQHQIRPYLAVAEVGPLAAERMVMMLRLKRIIVRERLDDHGEALFEVAPYRPRETRL